MTDAPVVPLHRSPTERLAAVEPLLRDIVGEVLRAARLEQRRTLKDVAQRAGVSVPYLSEIERGRKEASSEVLAAVCGSLGISMLELVSRSQQGFVTQRRPAERSGASPRVLGSSVLALAGWTLPISPRREDTIGEPVRDGLLGAEHLVAVGICA